jgi:hypothetical protein
MPKNYISSNERCEKPSLKQEPTTKNVFETGKLMNTLKNMVAAMCMESIKKEGGNFQDARKIADEAFERFMLDDRYHTQQKWVSFFAEYLKKRYPNLTEDSMRGFVKRLRSFGANENMSSLVHVRAQCERILKTQKDRLSKEDLEKVRQIYYDVTAKNF